MTTRQNPEHGPATLYVVLDDDGGIVMLEGRPAIYETAEAAGRARKRCSRPSRCTVRQIDRLDAGGETLMRTGPPDGPGQSID